MKKESWVRGRRFKIVIKDDLEGKELNGLFSLVELYCDKFSVEGVYHYTGALDRERFDEIQKEMSEYYASLTYLGEGTPLTFKIKYKDIIYGSQKYDINHPDLLYKVISGQGVDATGNGLYCHCYFVMGGEVYNSVIKTMKGLFSSPRRYGRELFSNIVFYAGKVQMLILYGYLAILDLSEEQYKEFLNPGIEHEEYIEGHYYVTDVPFYRKAKKYKGWSLKRGR